MLDSKQRFKAAFIARCIEEGCTSPDEILGRVKTAREKVAIVGSVLSGAKEGIKGVLGLGALGAAGLVAAPAIGGFAAGTAAGNLKGINDVNIDEIKRQELIDELRRQTARLDQHNQAQARKSQKDKKRSGRAFI